MKRILTIVFAFAIALGGAAAGMAEPGPDTGNSEKGLCTAFFNGQKNGHDKQEEKNGSYPGPFADLVTRAADSDGNGTPGETSDVYAYCLAFGIGGNPDHSGRWTCSTDDNDTPNDTSDDTYTCNPNDAPGNS